MGIFSGSLLEEICGREGDMFVIEYEVEFMRLSCYVPVIYARFEFGLRSELMMVFEALPSKTKICEKVRRIDRRRKEQARVPAKRESDLNVQPPRPVKRTRDDRPHQNIVVVGGRIQNCSTCGKRYKQPALVYATRCREDRDATYVITGSFTVDVIPYFALIDIGSTHSYVSCEMADKLGIWVNETVSKVIVLSPLGQYVHVNKIYKRCLLQVQGEVFPTDLMEFPFGEFDLILGMDWLSEHRVSLDYDTKQVTLRTLDGNEIIMIREHQKYLSNVISALVADNLIRKGCKAYLAYILDSNVDGAILENISIVKEFPNIFLEELPSLPAKCVVEFEIELLPGIASMPITPYHMALKEFKELKV
ncbi:DNA/RNA polymerases superfamily protein [Gossypium australe]|uniref:DNA/RNA polymerases superfamily protein n=1 Tax=Gossypium australe TaxID=47621 RepID=A0A5B6U8W8_9ROSI|nr:DNA/RNA polymerases superfamily protein [Gossypium australe]